MNGPSFKSSMVNPWAMIHFILEAANPFLAMKNAIQILSANTIRICKEKIVLSENSKLKVGLLGKAAVTLAEGAIPILKERADAFFMACLPDQSTRAKKLVKKHGIEDFTTIVIGDHPIPTRNSLEAGMALLEFTKRVQRNDLLLLFISGGGSAMVEVPKDGLSILDLQQMNHVLLRCGASINDINTIRKHVSSIKGGQLAQHCCGRIEALLISDVPGDDPSIIASGLTAPDPSTFHDCLTIINKYHLSDDPEFPRAITRFIKQNIGKDDQETPKVLNDVHNHVLLSSTIVRSRVEIKMKELGFHPLRVDDTLSLDQSVEDVAKDLFKRIQLASSSSVEHERSFVMATGEPLVIVRGNGRGGRCSELALRTLKHLVQHSSILDHLDDLILIFLATDGKDGNSDSAGILLTKETITRILKRGAEVNLETWMESFLQDSNSLGFFVEIADETIIRVEANTTNVRDFFIGVFKKAFKTRER